MATPPPDGLNFIYFGPDSNCTLDLCPIEASVYRYRPSLPANIVFVALYSIAGLLHAYLGFRWRQWFFTGCIIAGCIIEVVGYVGRVLMYGNPFDFTPFLMQIVCITFGPVFYTAAIYITLSKTIERYSPSISRLRPPKLYYYIFIPADVLCLILQAAGGALSASTSGASQTGVDVALAGLALQVVVIVAFCALFADHMLRYFLRSRSKSNEFPPLSKRMWVFIGGLYGATLIILARCAFRCYELEEGYDGAAVADEALFIGLEGVLIVIAVFLLGIGHPGLVFGRPEKESVREKGSARSSESV